jgi:hypothetical protein
MKLKLALNDFELRLGYSASRLDAADSMPLECSDSARFTNRVTSGVERQGGLESKDTANLNVSKFRLRPKFSSSSLFQASQRKSKRTNRISYWQIMVSYQGE